jgi:hypothetical protein
LFVCFLPWVVFLCQRNERSRAWSVGFLWLWYVIYLVLYLWLPLSLNHPWSLSLSPIVPVCTYLSPGSG